MPLDKLGTNPATEFPGRASFGLSPTTIGCSPENFRTNARPCESLIEWHIDPVKRRDTKRTLKYPAYDNYR